MRLMLVAIIILSFALQAHARDVGYELSLTSEVENLYRVDGRSDYIWTSYCSRRVRQQDVFLRMSGNETGRVRFEDRSNECMVSAFFSRITQPPIKTSFDFKALGDRVFFIGLNFYVISDDCENLQVKPGEIPVLDWAGEHGVLRSETNSCKVNGIYQKRALE